MGHDETISYLDSVPNVEFLTEWPDIEITYNQSKLSDMCFSFDMSSEDKYDFISIAMRDILIGLGFTSSFRYNPITKGLDFPTQTMIPFESVINEGFGYNTTPQERLTKATKGEFVLGNKYQNLKLYAPAQWQNGKSLNYFIPQDDCLLSQILSYNFCKGMAYRSISDDYDSFVFENLLYWKANFTVGSGSVAPSYGSTSLLMPFNGSIKLDDPQYGVSTHSNKSTNETTLQRVHYDKNEVSRYAQAFHPFISIGPYSGSEGTSVCLLKKDGTWDLVQFIPFYEPDMTFSMSDWILSCENDEYARTVDGYLRARITTKYQTGSSSSIITTTYKSTFLVVDYLPQIVSLSYEGQNLSFKQLSSDKTMSEEIPTRLYFSDIEGIDHIVLERLRKGSRIPSKIEVTDFRKGYYDTTIDLTTTFTAIGYNKNGSTRGTPITVYTLGQIIPPVSFNIVDNNIVVDGLDGLKNARCEIVSINTPYMSLPEFKLSGNVINIQDLSAGMYAITLFDDENKLIGQYKFKK